MMSKLIKSLFLASLAILVVPGLVYASFGVSPSQVVNDHLLSGSHFEQDIIISRATPGEELRAEVTVDAPEIESWFSFSPGKEFSLPKGEQRVPMTVIIDVPEGTPLGEYKGFLRIRAIPIGEGQAGITVVEGARVDVGLVLTEVEITDFIIRLLDISDIEEGRPIKLLIKAENAGNKEASLTKAHLDIFDLSDNLLESLDDYGLEPIKPFETKEIYGEFPTKLGPGEYYAQAQVFQREEVLREEKIYFRILEASEVPTAEVREEAEATGVGGLGGKAPLIGGLVALASVGVAFLLTRLSGADLTTLLRGITLRRAIFGLVVLGILTTSGYLIWRYRPRIRIAIEVGGSCIGTGCVRQHEAEEEEHKVGNGPSYQGEDLRPIIEQEAKESKEEAEAGEVAGESVIKTPEPRLDVLPENKVKKFLIYTQPSLSSQVLYEAKEGETLNVVDEENGWYQVDLPDGRLGWLPRSSVQSSVQAPR